MATLRPNAHVKEFLLPIGLSRPRSYWAILASCVANRALQKALLLLFTVSKGDTAQIEKCYNTKRDKQLRLPVWSLHGIPSSDGHGKLGIMMILNVYPCDLPNIDLAVGRCREMEDDIFSWKNGLFSGWGLCQFWGMLKTTETCSMFPMQSLKMFK